jgi:ribosomal protein S18 acetylase RimI-like enzyme
VIEVRPYISTDFAGVDHLWLRCFPDDPPHNRAAIAVPAKLAMKDDLLLVAVTNDGQVAGSVIAGWDGHRGWLYAVAVDPDLQKRGIGRALIEAALARLADLDCGKVNLQIREGNEAVIAFYAALGFSVEPRTSMGIRLV